MDEPYYSASLLDTDISAVFVKFANQWFHVISCVILYVHSF